MTDLAAPHGVSVGAPAGGRPPDDPVVEQPPPRRGALDRLPPWVVLGARPVGIYVASRFVVLIAMWMASRISPPVSVGSAITDWDGNWYIDTADYGYPRDLPLLPDGLVGQNRTAFFPLYPLCMRFVKWFGFPTRVSGIIVAGAAGVAAAVLLWLLLRRVWDQDAADRGVALFCFFPGAMILSMTYSEPLMLALAIGCLLALHHRWWLLAGVLAGLCTATRPNALAIVAACAWAAGAAIWQRREWRALVAPLLAPTGFIAFQLFLWAHTGRSDAWFVTQKEGWGEQMSLSGNWRRISETVKHPLGDVNITLAVAGMVLIAVFLLLLIRSKTPAPAIVFAVGIVLFAAVSETIGPRPRFVLAAFPLVVLPARWVKGPAFTALVAGSATVLGALTVLSSTTRLATP